VVVGESVNYIGGQEWLKENGTVIVDLHSDRCIQLLHQYIKKNHTIWKEDIGELQIKK
jgi:cytosine deaminase